MPHDNARTQLRPIINMLIQYFFYFSSSRSTSMTGLAVEKSFHVADDPKAVYYYQQINACRDTQIFDIAWGDALSKTVWIMGSCWSLIKKWLWRISKTKEEAALALPAIESVQIWQSWALWCLLLSWVWDHGRDTRPSNTPGTWCDQR